MPDHPFQSGDHVVAYLRDSGHENQELSIERQETEIRAFCMKNGLILLRPYIDEARPGSDDENRPQLAEMMHDLRHGLAVAGVLVWSSSRFARNSLHAQFYRAEIRKLGYIFHSLTGKTMDGPEAIIFEAIDDYKNERFLTDLSLDVKSGLRKLILNYGCVPGVAPTGFTRQPVIIGQHRDGRQRIAHKWLPDPLYIPRVRRAFEMRAAGLSLGEINTETRLFTSLNSYRTFFCNKIYLGILEFGDDVVVENYCEPMVDRSIWDAVQAIQNHYTRHKNLAGGPPQHPRRINSQYLLSGLVHCARCGSPLFGRSHPQRNGSKTISYYCTRAYNKRDCTKQRIPGLPLETAIIKALQEIYLHPDYLEAAYAEMRALNATRLDEYHASRRQVTLDLAELRRQITNVSNAIAETGHSHALLVRLSDLETQETGLLNRIAALDALNVREIPPLDKVQAETFAASFAATFARADTQQKRRILRGYIQRIDVDREGRRLFGTLTVYYPPDDPGEPPPSEANPPGGLSVGGMKTVRIPSKTSGPPLLTHIFHFEQIILGKSGRYQKTRSV